MFTSQGEADAYLKKFKEHPELWDSMSPEVVFLDLYVQQDGFVVHELKQTNQTEFVPKGNFFVSVNGKQNWAYEELGNTVTLIANATDYSPAVAGPVAGLLKTGQAFCNEFRVLGMNVIGSPTVTSKGEADLIAGRLIQGLAYKGEVLYDGEGRATNILCTVETPSNPHDLNFDVSYSGDEKYPAHVLQTIRRGGQGWRPYIEYKIINASSLSPLLRMETFWTGFTNDKTRVAVYDPATKAISFLNRKSPPLASTRLASTMSSRKENSGVRSRRTLLLSVFAGVSIGIALTVLIKLKKRTTEP